MVCEGAMTKASRSVVTDLFIDLMVRFDTYGPRGPAGTISTMIYPVLQSLVLVSILGRFLVKNPIL